MVISLNIPDIFNNVLASAVWLFIGLGAAAAYRFVASGRHLRRIWRFGRGKHDVHIVVASLTLKKSGGYRWPTTGLGDLHGASHVNQSLANAYSRNKLTILVWFSSDFPGPALRDTVVIVGSPLYNSAAALMLKRAGLRFTFAIEPEVTVHDAETDVVYAAVGNPESPTTDYAVISRFVNPYNAASFILNIAGLHTFGTAGASRMLTDDYAVALAAATREFGESWQVLLEVEVVEHQFFPRILTASGIDDDPGRGSSPGV